MIKTAIHMLRIKTATAKKTNRFKHYYNIVSVVSTKEDSWEFIASKRFRFLIKTRKLAGERGIDSFDIPILTFSFHKVCQCDL